MHEGDASTLQATYPSEDLRLRKLWKNVETSEVDVAEIQDRISRIQWFHTYELLPGVMTNGASDMLERAPYFQIPKYLTGKRVLDVGCADGFFTFLAECRGATVVAIDSWPREGFFLAREVLRSRAEFHHMNVYDIHPDVLGMFDIVFFFGVYYHLKNPILALERIANVTREYAIIESEIMPAQSLEEKSLPGHAHNSTTSDRRGLEVVIQKFLGLKTPEPAPELDSEGVIPEQPDALGLSRFYEHDELANDPTNWWVPDMPCLMQTVRAAGFPQAEFVNRYHTSRGVVRAHKGPRTAGKILTEDFFVAIDTPLPNAELSGTVLVSGWALSQLDPERGIERVVVYLDNLDDPTSELGEAEYGGWRGHQVAHFGDRYGAVGFEFTWSTIDVPPGEHTLHVLAEGKRGWNYRSVPITLTNG